MHSELESQSNQNLQQVAVEQNNSYHLLSKNNWSLKTVDLESIFRGIPFKTTFRLFTVVTLYTFHIYFFRINVRNLL